MIAKGTSIYAYDGSYKKDIANRYFTRAILKPLSEKSRLQVEAKVPHLVDRTSHTLSSLIKLREVA